jgi:GntR family transcriptional regulator, rspAB operon transcriptional repressor
VFPSGEPLTEKVLASRYGGSRTPLREAAVRLQQENLLRIIPKKGYFIAHMSVHELNELYEFRAWIEGVCAEIAARTGSDPDQLDNLERLAGVQYDNREGYFRFIEADTAFHLGIAKLTGNSMLVKAVADIRVHMERLMYAASSVAPYSQITSQEHRSIIAAIRNRNAKLARKLVHSHILDAKENILKLAGGTSRL